MRRFLVFVACAALVALAVGSVGGSLVDERYGGAEARAWRLGCVVTFVASLVSGSVVAVASRRDAQGVILAMGAMLVRLLVLGLAGTAVVVGLGLQVRPFLLSVAASYLALLVVDTWYALTASRESDS